MIQLRINVVYLGNSEAIRLKVKKLLQNESLFSFFDNMTSALEHLKSHPGKTDIFIASDLKDMDPLGGVLALKEESPNLPIIVLSENKKSSLAIEIIKAGAYAFFLLPISYSELIDSL